MDLSNRIEAVRRLEIELLGHYQQLCKDDVSSASAMLDCSFDIINWLANYDNDLLETRLNRLFAYNRSSIFKVRGVMSMSSRSNTGVNEMQPQTSYTHSKIKTAERKIISTLREICSIDMFIACACFGISYEDAYALQNTTLDMVEEWVYSSRTTGVLALKFKNKGEAEKLLNIERLSVASIYLDRIAV